MEGAESASRHDVSPRDYRVRVDSKTAVVQQIEEYKELLRRALDGQAELPGDAGRLLLHELLANFEAAVLDNVLVNGQPWEEAPDDGDEAMCLENQLDDTIVEVSRRRRRYPREILPHVVHCLKAERRLMGLYDETVKPQELVKDPHHESIMNNVSAEAPGMVKQAIHVIKSIKTLQKQAEGLCQVLDTKPSHATLDIHKEVFCHVGQSEAATPSLSNASLIRQPIKRAVGEATARSCFVPPTKKAA